MKKENRTYADRREYNIRKVAERRRKLRLMAIENAGGECIKCGYKKYLEVLEFHHKDPSQKEFGIAQGGLTRSWKRIKAETEKCFLLCANCHREQHVEERLNKLNT